LSVNRLRGDSRLLYCDILDLMNPDYTPTEKKDDVFINPNADLLEKLRINKEGSTKFRERRQPDWTENYTLYRDKIQLNRLTQRQSVNIPLIKATVKTLLKDIDDAPMLYFSNLDNNDQAEVFYNEYWKYNSQMNQLVIKDIVDKRQVLLFGRSFKFMNIIDGNFQWEVVDPQDVLVDRYVDPANIDTARFVIREHIYKPLSSLATNPKYDKAAVKRLQEFMSTEAGLLKAEENGRDWVDKQARMAALGVVDTFSPILGETYVELNDFYIFEFNKKTGKDEITYITTAEAMEVIYSAPLQTCVGPTQDNFWQTHYPCTTWGEETERTDFWNDGVCDPLRPLNKILNAFFSQRVENRTLRSFGMNYYNSSLTEEGFLPQTFEPVPWGWYPIPAGESGKLGDQIMRVDVPDLSDVEKDMQFILGIAQQVSAATNTQQGVKDPGATITLGQVQLMLANAKERVKSMAVYYNASWEDFGLKYVKMLEATGDLLSPVIINKKGRLTKKYYAKQITPEMWYSKAGHKVEVRMKEDVQSQTADSLQKLQYSKTLMPMNMALDNIIKQKSLEFADLNSSEMEEVMKEDELQMKQMSADAQMMGPQLPGQQPGQPGQPQTGAPGITQPTPRPMAAI